MNEMQPMQPLIQDNIPEINKKKSKAPLVIGVVSFIFIFIILAIVAVRFLVPSDKSRILKALSKISEIKNYTVDTPIYKPTNDDDSEISFIINRISSVSAKMNDENNIENIEISFRDRNNSLNKVNAVLQDGKTLVNFKDMVNIFKNLDSSSEESRILTNILSDPSITEYNDKWIITKDESTFGYIKQKINLNKAKEYLKNTGNEDDAKILTKKQEGDNTKYSISIKGRSIIITLDKSDNITNISIDINGDYVRLYNINKTEVKEVSAKDRISIDEFQELLKKAYYNNLSKKLIKRIKTPCLI